VPWTKDRWLLAPAQDLKDAITKQLEEVSASARTTASLAADLQSLAGERDELAESALQRP